MSDGLKWARRMRLELAIEIEQMERGLRIVTQITPQGPTDITVPAVDTLKKRFGQLEDLIAALGPSRGDDAEAP